LAKTEEILDGLTTVEDAMSDLALLSAIAGLCGDPRSQAFLITASIGMPSPVIRALRAATARHTAVDVRSNVLYVLTQVLVGNGEGVVAFHTARRAVCEATSAMGWKDNQVLVIALKTGLALQIVKDKVAIATEVLNGKNPTNTSRPTLGRPSCGCLTGMPLNTYVTSTPREVSSRNLKGVERSGPHRPARR